MTGSLCPQPLAGKGGRGGGGMLYLQGGHSLVGGPLAWSRANPQSEMSWSLDN